LEKLLLFKYYRWKNEKLKLTERIRTVSIVTWIFLLASFAAFAVFLLLCINHCQSDLLYLPLLFEGGFMILMNYFFKLDRSQKSGVDYDRYRIFCKEVKLWLEANDIRTKNQVYQLSSCYKEIAGKKRKRFNFPINVSRQWLLFLLVPVSFSLLSHLIELTDATMFIFQDITLLLLLYTALYFIVLGSYELFTYLFTTGRNTAQDFVEALNGVLVFCFDENGEEKFCDSPKTSW